VDGDGRVKLEDEQDAVAASVALRSKATSVKERAVRTRRVATSDALPVPATSAPKPAKRKRKHAQKDPLPSGAQAVQTAAPDSSPRRKRTTTHAGRSGDVSAPPPTAAPPDQKTSSAQVSTAPAALNDYIDLPHASPAPTGPPTFRGIHPYMFDPKLPRRTEAELVPAPTVPRTEWMWLERLLDMRRYDTDHPYLAGVTLPPTLPPPRMGVPRLVAATWDDDELDMSDD
jgi:hypothetical protein